MSAATSCSLIAHVDGAHVDGAHVDGAHVDGAHVDGAHVDGAHVDGAFHAMRRTCPHMGADLCKGKLDGRIVTCRLHEAAFDVTTGKAIDKPETRHLKMLFREPTSFAVEVRDGKVMVAV